MSQARALVRKGSLSLAVRVAGIALSFPASILLSRLLGIEQFGAYSIALSCASVMAIAVRLGLENTATRFVAVYRQRGDGELLRSFFSYALKSMSIAWLAALAAAALWLFLREADDRPSLLLVASAAIAAFALAALGVLSAVLRVFDRIFESQFYEQLLRPLLIILLVGALWLAGTRIDAPLGMALTAASLVTATTIAFVRSYLLAQRVACSGNMASEKALWTQMGWAVAVMSVLMETLNQLEVILLGLLASSADSALFAAAQRLSSLTVLGMTAVVMVSGPRIAAAFHSDDFAGLAELAKASARLCFASSLVLAGGLLVVGPLLLQLWGTEFPAAGPALNILLIGALVNAATGSAGYLTILTGHERAALVILILTLVLTLILEAILIPRFGVIGAAMGSAFGLTLWNLLMAGFVRLRLGIDCTVLGRPPSWPAGKAQR